MTRAIAPEKAAAEPIGARQEYGGEEDDDADRTRLALQDVIDNVQDHKCRVSLQGHRICGLWEQHEG